MADPNRIHILGPVHYVNTYPAFEEITPGMEIELYNDGGTLKWKKKSSATTQGTGIFAGDWSEMNRGVDDTYAAGELLNAGYAQRGTQIWALIPSGQDIDPAEPLGSNGDGKLKSVSPSVAGDNIHRWNSLEDTGAVTADTRIRVEAT